MPGDGKYFMIHINAHEIVLDNQEKLEGWCSYDHVIRLAMGFIAHCPVDPVNRLPWYMQYSCFWIDPLRPAIWPDNPAGKYAWAVMALIRYYPYSGDHHLIDIVRNMLDRLWQYRTPENYSWGGIPYASAHPGSGNYFGARADGEYATEPDKVAQVGRAYLDFYELTGEDKYLQMGSHCAEVLAEKLRPGDKDHSPVPFRVAVRDGNVIEAYTAHIIPLVRLFDEMIRLGENNYQAPRDLAWNWLEEYPLRNNIWKGHFEDIRIDPENKNRDQLSALETSRYILQHHQHYPEWKTAVKGILEWVIRTLGGAEFFSAIPIHEQLFCYFPMGSHTARFASICARYAELTGDEQIREYARRSFNWATYMANEDGTVTVGIDRPDYYNQCWFTDGYFDYVPHFIEGMASMPECAPCDSDHLLRSTNIIQHISYKPLEIAYRSFDISGTQKFRLSFYPVQVLAGSTPIERKQTLNATAGWCWDDESRVLDINPEAREVLILGR
jgi:hypothetical protein